MARPLKNAEEVPLSDFKARCSEFVEKVARDRREVVITRRGQPVARLVAEGGRTASPAGAFRGLVQVDGDIVHVDWSDEFEAARE